MGATLVVDHGVDFVDNHGACGPQHLPAFFRGEQNEQRLGRRDQDVRRPDQHLLPLRGQRVAGAQRRADRRQKYASLVGKGRDLGERGVQVLLHIVAEGFERRDINHLHPVGKRSRTGGADQVVDTQQKRGESFPRPGGGGDQDIVSRTNLRPAEGLWFGRLREAARKPVGNKGVKADRHGRISIFACGAERRATNGQPFPESDT